MIFVMDIKDISDEREKKNFPLPKSVESFFIDWGTVSFSIRTLPNPGDYLLNNYVSYIFHLQWFSIGEEEWLGTVSSI